MGGGRWVQVLVMTELHGPRGTISSRHGGAACGKDRSGGPPKVALPSPRSAAWRIGPRSAARAWAKSATAAALCFSRALLRECEMEAFWG